MQSDIREIIENRLSRKVVSMPYGDGVVETEGGDRYFLKKGRRSAAFRCEASGLAELAAAEGINVPGAVLWGDDFILSEYIEPGRPADGFYTELGRMVARLHRRTGPRFGFREDNFIGANPQPNIAEGAEATDWAEFYYGKRLKYQLEMALGTGYFGKRVWDILYRLRETVDRMLSHVDEPPTLLHGDLWSGNYLCSTTGAPYLIDPAVYYGHRETDIAMTMLFGGFPEEFYRAYDEAYPLQDGWRERVPLYQLYHVLNHLNIFGSGYLRQAESLIGGLTR
ncbi:MAG: fructosamine kinase family protein [Rikenellaceae bacterium]|nr:fructosamine kinase family protein [Rikenellaceae bacterium]